MPLRDQLQASLGDAYVLEQELGGGGMSRVFVAEDRALGRKVVVKVLSPELAAGVSSERFSREIRVAAGLQQANIVPLHAAGETCGLPYYTMPFVEGQSLRQRLTVSGPLSIGEAINVLRDVARALAYAHEHGVIHRDIKPENVLLSGDAAVVTDFGIAKALSAARGERAAPAEQEDNRDPTALTVAGAAIGTPAYMAPEQALGDPDTDHRADVYSFGCLAYELLTGNTPFHGRSMQQVLVAHVQEQAPDVAAARKDAPPALVGLVSRCLKKDPRERPQSAREILGALDAVATPGPGLFAPVAAPARRRWSGRAIVFGLAAAAVVGVAAVVVRGRWMTGASEPRALAVMPFTNVGGDSTQQYFADGIAIDLTNALTKVSGLRVTSRSLAFTYQGKAVDVRTVGKELNVDAVVEGTVQRSGTGLRVTSQLTRTSDGVTLWSKEFDRETKDVFGVQDTITNEIVGELRLTLAGQGGGTERTVAGTRNFDAYDSYMRGVYLLDHRGPGVPKSVDHFNDAIAKDSGFARAYGKLSEALELLPYFTSTTAASVEARAVDAAERALALDSTVAEAYIGLALARDHAFRWQEGESAFKRAIALDPGFATARMQYGRHLMYRGRLDEATAQFRRATELDPQSGTAFFWLAHMMSLSGRHESSLAIGRRAREIDPGLVAARTFGAMDAVSAGRPDLVRQLVSGLAASAVWRGQAAYSLGAVGDTSGARAVIRELERLPRDTWLVHTGLTYAFLGVADTARALAELEAAVRAREITPKWVTFTHRMFDPIRRTPRFAAVVRAYGLDERLMMSEFGGRPVK